MTERQHVLSNFLALRNINNLRRDTYGEYQKDKQTTA